MDEPARPAAVPAVPDEPTPAASPDVPPTVAPQPVADFRRWPPSRRVVLVAIAAIAIAVVLVMGRGVLGPFVVGLVLAYLLDPPIEWLSRRRVPRWISVLLVYAAVVLILFFSIRLLIRPIIDQIASFIDDLPAFADRLADMYVHLDLPLPIREIIDGLLADLAHVGEGFDPSILLPFVGGIANLLGSILGYIVIPVWMFYLLKDRPRLAASVDRSLPTAWRSDVWTVFSLGLRVFGQWLRGQLFLGLTVGIATFIGLLVLGWTVDPVFLRFAAFLALIAGVLELLPIIGPIIAAIPAVLLALTAGVGPAIAALLLYLLIQQVENHVLVPKIQGDAVDLHPIVVIFALVVGGAVAGLLGAILALPITAAARDMFRYISLRLDDPPAAPDEAAAIIRGVRPAEPAPPGRTPPAPSPSPAQIR